jgi:hypothetical protein
VKLQLVNAGINCPNCNEYISQVHQNRSVLVRDLSILGQVVYLMDFVDRIRFVHGLLTPRQHRA